MGQRMKEGSEGKWTSTHLLTKVIHLGQILQLCVLLLRLQHKPGHIGFEGVNHCTKYICFGAGVSTAKNHLCLLHKCQGLLFFLL